MFFFLKTPLKIFFYTKVFKWKPAWTKWNTSWRLIKNFGKNWEYFFSLFQRLKLRIMFLNTTYARPFFSFISTINLKMCQWTSNEYLLRNSFRNYYLLKKKFLFMYILFPKCIKIVLTTNIVSKTGHLTGTKWKYIDRN